jgi:glycerol uptake facilitator protein
LTGAQVGVFQVAIVWGLGIATAIYPTGALSGAHLNPAVTVSMAAWADFPRCRVVPYVATQLLGAFAAAAVLYFIFRDALVVFEKPIIWCAANPAAKPARWCSVNSFRVQMGTR